MESGEWFSVDKEQFIISLQYGQQTSKQGLNTIEDT